MSELERTQRSVVWDKPFINITAAKPTLRMGVPQLTGQGRETAYELVGFEGQVAGGMRRFPGFIEIDDFDLFADGSFTANGAVTVQGFRPFRITVNQTTDVYGYVLRIKDSDGTYFFVRWREEENATWYTYRLTDNLTINDDAIWSLAEIDRLLYVYVEGQTPVLFYLSGTAGPFTANDVGGVSGGTVGPGPQPRTLQPGDLPAAGGAEWTPTTLAFDADDPNNSVGKAKLFVETADPEGNGHSKMTGYPDANSDVSKVDPGTYIFAFQLFDSRTGRRSKLSQVVELNAADFPTQDDGTGTQVPVSAYLTIGIVYDSTSFDKAYIYRSVNAGGVYASGYLHLDRLITLDDYGTENQSSIDPSGKVSGTPKRSFYYYRLRDRVHAGQSPYLEAREYEDNPPKGGAVLYYNNSLLVSSIEDGSGDALTPKGLFRWSTLTYPSSELFPTENRNNPDIPGVSVDRLLPVGGNAIGFSKAEMVHYRRESFYLRGERVHRGYGIVNDRAATTVASIGYIVTSKGLKAVDANAQLDDITTLDSLIREDWLGSQTGISMAYDSEVGCIFILNPTLEQTACLWLTTAAFTEVHDTRFLAVEEGAFPVDVADNPPSEDLTTRAFFLQDLNTTAGRVRVLVMDHERDKTIPSLMDIEGEVGDADAELTNWDAGSSRMTFTGATFSDRMVGSYIYKWNTDNTYARTRITGVVSSTVVEVAASSGWASGDKVSISPVYTRWVSPPIGLEEETPGGIYTTNFFINRKIEAVALNFVDTAGSSLNESHYARYRGLVFVNNDSSPSGYGFPRDHDDGSEIISISDGEAINYAAIKRAGQDTNLRGSNGVMGSTLAAGFDVIATDLDFRVISARITGKILETSRSTRPT